MPPLTPSAISATLQSPIAIGNRQSAVVKGSFSIFFSRTSFWAILISFSLPVLPVVLGVQPLSSCFARAPAITTNSNALPLVPSRPYPPFQTLDDSFRERSCRSQSRALGGHNGLEASHAALELVVDDHVVVLDERGDLCPGGRQAALHRLFGVL